MAEQIPERAPSWFSPGRPYLKRGQLAPQATDRVEFPRMTNELTVVCQSPTGMFVFFADPEVTDAFAQGALVELALPGQSFTLRVGVEEVFLRNPNADDVCDYQILAELANSSDPDRYPPLRGEGIGNTIEEE